jgi:hypothetical protein
LIALFELLVTFLVEIFGQVLVGVVWDLLASSTRHAFGHERRTARPELAALGFVLFGGLAGVVSALVRPGRVTPAGPLPGLSLVLAPLVTGLAMHFYGRWRRGRGYDTTYLATYWGGALLAFAMAFARFLMVD